MSDNNRSEYAASLSLAPSQSIQQHSTWKDASRCKRPAPAKPAPSILARLLAWLGL